MLKCLISITVNFFINCRCINVGGSKSQVCQKLYSDQRRQIYVVENIFLFQFGHPWNKSGLH
jgi:hypothetical protein